MRHGSHFGLYRRPEEVPENIQSVKGTVTFLCHNSNSGYIVGNGIKRVDGERPDKVCGGSWGFWRRDEYKWSN